MSLNHFNYIEPGTFFHTTYLASKTIAIYYCSPLTSRPCELTKPLTQSVKTQAMIALGLNYVPYIIFTLRNSGQLTHWQELFLSQTKSVKHDHGDFYEYYY